MNLNQECTSWFLTQLSKLFQALAAICDTWSSTKGCHLNQMFAANMTNRIKRAL